MIESAVLEERCGAKQDELPMLKLAEGALARYAGNYTQPNTEIAVAVDGARLRADVVTVDPKTGRRTPFPAVPLRPIGENRFVATDGESKGSRVAFIMGEGEKPRFVRFGGRLADYLGT